MKSMKKTKDKPEIKRLTADGQGALDALLADEALADEALMKRAVAEAVASGSVVDCSEDVGYAWWVALSRATYEDCVAWVDDAAGWCEQHEEMRRIEVLGMLLHCVRAHHAEGDVVPFHVLRIPRGGDTPELRELVMRVRGSWLIVTLPGEADPLTP
jgi:hypothetical protein